MEDRLRSKRITGGQTDCSDQGDYTDREIYYSDGWKIREVIKNNVLCEGECTLGKIRHTAYRAGYPKLIQGHSHIHGTGSYTHNFPPQSVFTNWKVNKTNVKDMKVVKEQSILINDKKRDVTIVVLNKGNKLKAGYSVRMPKDKKNKELAIKIATGRAESEKTNLVDMELGKGMAHKYILYAVAESTLRQIERGLIELKGVK